MENTSFLYHVFVYLLTAIITVPIAKKIGLGSVLGYLLAGVVIGPFGIGFIRQPEHIMHFAEFGVVLMLFLIGLELKPSLLWRMRGPVLGLGGLQVTLTAAAIALVALLFSLPVGAAVTVGLILAMSSTAIVVQSLSEKNLLKTQAGQHAFSVLLFQDMAVIPILAIVPLLAMGGALPADSSPLPVTGWQRGLLIMAMISALILGGRFLTRPIFRLIAESRIRELFTAFALLLVIGIALAMQSVGLSAALGTFLAGVVLAESEYRHALESDIEPFKGLLLGLFFISVGAGVDFALLRHEWMLAAAIVVGLVAIKFAILYLLGRFYKMSHGENFLFSFALAQGGEFAFVLAAFSVQHNVISNEISDLLVASVAMSMLTTPLLLILYERLIQPRFLRPTAEAASDAIAPHSNPVIIAGFGRFGQIVGRLLHANGIGTTVLDHDPSQIELLRKFDFKVFYGDATRMDLLKAAGAAEAVLLVIALDDPQATIKLIEEVKREFPRLKILARAPGRLDAYDLLNHKIDGVYRETFGSALDMGVDALRLLGFGAYEALRAGRLFRRHDERALRELAALRHDESVYVPRVKQLRAELDELFKRDDSELSSLEDPAWEHTPRDEPK